MCTPNGPASGECSLRWRSCARVHSVGWRWSRRRKTWQRCIFQLQGLRLGPSCVGSQRYFPGDIPSDNGMPITPRRRGRIGLTGVPCRTDFEPAGGGHREATPFPRIRWASEQPQGLGLLSLSRAAGPPTCADLCPRQLRAWPGEPVRRMRDAWTRPSTWFRPSRPPSAPSTPARTSPGRRTTRCWGSAEGRCTPTVALPSLMYTTSITSSSSPAASFAQHRTPLPPVGLVPGSFSYAASGTASPKRLSLALGVSERVASVPFSSGMVSPLLVFHSDTCSGYKSRLSPDFAESLRPQDGSRSTAGTPRSTVAPASTVRSKYPSSVLSPFTRPKHGPVSAFHSVMNQRQPV